jgi:hypothetical protein
MSQMKAILDRLLSNVSSMQLAKGTICEQLLPTIKAAQTSGKLAKYGKSHLRIEKSLKGGRGAYRRVEAITRSTTDFSMEGHGLEGMVTKEDYRNVELPFKAEEDETTGITSMLLLEKEKTLADTLTSTSIVTQNTTLSGTSQFSDYLNSDPIAIFSTGRKTVRDACGDIPNVAAMDWGVYNKLRFHPQMLDALGYKQARPGGLKAEELAVALDVEKIMIANCVYNSAKEGQTDVLAPIWGKHVVLGVLPEKAAVYQTSGGYLVQPEGSTPRKVYKTDVFNPPGSKLILVEDEYDMLISDVTALYLIKDVIA